MAIDAVLLERAGNTDLGPNDRELLKHGPLPFGRSYIISAKGSILATKSQSRLTLEAFGERDSVDIGFSEKQGQASFFLVVGVTLPPDDSLFVEAKVTGRSLPFSGAPETSITSVRGLKLVVLPVDSVTVTKVQT